MKKYISYFQSVITIGIMSNGVSSKEASEKAKMKLLNADGVNHCYFDQTDFEIAKIEQWKPEIEEDPNTETMSFKFDPAPETRNIIATRLQKRLQDLTEDDYQRFVKESIEKALEK